jgi:hypothetical protein
MGASKRRKIEPTHDWQLLLPLFRWPEQERYEEIRPLVLFDVTVVQRAAEVGTSASTLYRSSTALLTADCDDVAPGSTAA